MPRLEFNLDSVTVPNILDSFSMTYRGTRARCPIHGGENLTSFSFNDEVFQCFACGAKGGKLDLVEALGKVNRKEALRIVAEIAGVDDAVNLSGQSAVSVKRFRSKKVDAEEHALADRLSDIEKLQINYTERLQSLRRGRIARLGPSQRITLALICDDTLEGLAEEHKIIKDKLRALKKRNRRS